MLDVELDLFSNIFSLFPFMTVMKMKSHQWIDVLSKKILKMWIIKYE